MSGAEIAILLAIGLVAGLLGGLLGIGGSVIFIPAATLIIGPDQQVYQAAAMILNVAVAGTATIKHIRKKAIRPSVLKRMLPAAIVFVIAGVLLSNVLAGQVLMRLFGVLLLIIVIIEVLSLLKQRRIEDEEKETLSQAETWPVLGSIGAGMGFIGGLLGIGGGIFVVPLLRGIARFPLTQAIASAACVTLPMSLIGAILKNATLHQISVDGEPLSAWNSLSIAAVLIPTAIFGSWLGATLLHRLPINTIRIAFIALLIYVGLQMIGFV